MPAIGSLSGIYDIQLDEDEVQSLVIRPSLQKRLVKTGGRLIKSARYYWLLLAESHLTRRLFGSMVRRIAALPLPTG
jgi:hypothetical protein